MQAFAAENGVDLSKSYFYADGDEDVALMYLVGNPRPTNPAGKMAAVAAKRGWPVLRFSSRSGSNPVSQLRTAAGVASMVPIAAGALGLGLLTRNKRTGVNFFTSAFGRTLLTATGVNLNVLGKENLTKQRPAVFIFNHRNQVDPVIAGRLVDTNFTSVGKKELENDPIVGTIGKVMDAAFIDRDNPKAAVEGLKKVEENRPQRPFHPDRPGGHATRHHRGRPVQEGAVPHRDVCRNPHRAHRDSQRGGHLGPRLDDVQPRNRRRGRLPADLRPMTGPWRTCRTASPRCASSTSTR